MIQDANVFSNFNENYGLDTTMSIGDYSLYPGDEPRDIGYGLVKFPFLTGNSTFRGYYNVGRVTDIDYFFAVTDCVAQTTLQAKRIGTTWTETGVTYSAVSAYISGTGTAYTKTIDPTASPQYYCFDLMPMINTTTDYNNMATKGIVLCTDPESMPALTIATADAEAPSGYRPYVRYTYTSMPTTEVSGIVSGTTYMIVNAATGKALNGANITTLTSADVPYDTSLFILRYQTAGYYTIQMYAYDSDTFLTGESSLSLRVETDCTTQGWYLLPQGNGTYQIHNAANENMTIYTGSSSTYVYFGNSNVNNDWLLVPYILNVPLYEQAETDTCSLACIRMVLASFDVEKSEGQIETFCTNNGEGAIKNAINTFLPSNISDYSSVPYTDQYNSYLNKYMTSINNGCPVIINVIINHMNGGYFNYTSGTGHYIVGTGYYYDANDNLIFIINDPHYNDDINNIIHCRTIHIPATVLFDYRNPSNQYIIYNTG